MIYLDYAATSPISPFVLTKLTRGLEQDFWNPSGPHRPCLELHENIESARSSLLSQAGAGRQWKLIFTSGATESNTAIIHSLLLQQKTKVAFHEADHPSLVLALKHLAKIGKIRPMDAKVADVIYLTHLNSQSGQILDLGAQVDRLRKINPHAHIHVDGAQAFGKLTVSLSDYDIDSYTVSGHKIGAPKGIGGLFYKGDQFQPLFLGGGQEQGLRAGTQNAAMISAFEAAGEEAMKFLPIFKENCSRFQEMIRENFSHSCEFPFPDVNSPILCFVLPSIPSDVVLRHLETKEIYISSTSACSSRVKGLNPTFKALGIPEQWHKNVLRVSFGRDTKADQIKAFCHELKTTISELKGIMGKR